VPRADVDASARPGRGAAATGTKRSRPGVPRNKRGESREAILQAALTVFAKTGFKGATVREIARRARVNHATIRYHYETKDKLWRAAVSFLFERQASELALDELAAKGLGEAEFLREVVERYVRYCARHPEHARISVQESILGGARLRWMSREYIRTVHGVVAPYLERSMKKGLIRQTDPVSFLYILAVASQSIFLLDHEVQAVHGVDVFAPASVDRHVEAVLRLILDGAA
jgi:TetR/AcrR family transcriptional regulator